jgi:hypothetical protein
MQEFRNTTPEAKTVINLLTVKLQLKHMHQNN